MFRAAPACTHWMPREPSHPSRDNQKMSSVIAKCSLGTKPPSFHISSLGTMLYLRDKGRRVCEWGSQAVSPTSSLQEALAGGSSNAFQGLLSRLLVSCFPASSGSDERGEVGSKCSCPTLPSPPPPSPIPSFVSPGALLRFPGKTSLERAGLELAPGVLMEKPGCAEAEWGKRMLSQKPDFSTHSISSHLLLD